MASAVTAPAPYNPPAFVSLSSAPAPASSKTKTADMSATGPSPAVLKTGAPAAGVATAAFQQMQKQPPAIPPLFLSLCKAVPTPNEATPPTGHIKGVTLNILASGALEEKQKKDSSQKKDSPPILFKPIPTRAPLRYKTSEGLTIYDKTFPRLTIAFTSVKGGGQSEGKKFELYIDGKRLRLFDEDAIFVNSRKFTFENVDGYIKMTETESDGKLQVLYIDPKCRDNETLVMYSYLPTTPTETEAEEALRNVPVDYIWLTAAFNRHGTAWHGRNRQDQFLLYWARPGEKYAQSIKFDTFDHPGTDEARKHYVSLKKGLLSKDRQLLMRPYSESETTEIQINQEDATPFKPKGRVITVSS